MIFEVDHCDYYKLSYLMEDVKHFPEVRSIIHNSNPGKIYVDDTDHPKSALIYNQGMQGFYFVGDENNENFLKQIKSYIENKILDELLDKKINWFEISGVSSAWEKRIEELFKDRGIRFGFQIVLGLNENRFKKEGKLITDMDIRKVDKGIYELDVENLSFMINELELFWGTIENFFNNGIAYYVVADDKIASICYSGFKAGNIQTIGIETLIEYKKRGYAYSLAGKYIEDCFRQGISPHWDCSEDNTASMRLAEKLGFERKDRYKCYWFDF